jgi:hypothetical protein
MIMDTHLEDAREITCKTNRDASSCAFKVKCKLNEIPTKMSPLVLAKLDVNYIQSLTYDVGDHLQD